MTYKRPFLFISRHIETIYPALVRKVELPSHQTKRIETPDGDFLDLFIFSQQSTTVTIISHGLEGNALRHYMLGMTRACMLIGQDVITWNYRGCGHEMNKLKRFYHSGATEDLWCVIEYALKIGYQEINLIGFSLGGNITLKLLGENKYPLPGNLKKAFTLSVPMDLGSSCNQISQPSNAIYSHRFLKSLKNKILTKAKMRDDLDVSRINSIRNIREFDDYYTAPLHGFQDAIQYYDRCSSVRFVKNISIPTLIINAENDPFLSPECYPEDLLFQHPYVKFEVPRKGGHVGFTQFGKNGLYWSEEKAMAFFTHSVV